MSHVIEHDLGPLTWVKGEIDQALDRAMAAIDKAAIIRFIRVMFSSGLFPVHSDGASIPCRQPLAQSDLYTLA